MNQNLKCVYRHRRGDTNEVFYVGMGNDTKPYNFRCRSDRWKKIKNKCKNIIVEVLAENLDIDEAFELETFLISEYGRQDNNTGILINHTDGGEGNTNTIVSKETREKLSIHSKSLKRTKEWYDKVSKSLTGRKLTEEHKRKLREGKRKPGNKTYNCSSSNRKKVINIVSNQVYNSIHDASKDSYLSYSALAAQLRDQNKNTSNFKYYIEDASK